MTQSTRVDLGLRDSQPGEAQRPGAECPPAFTLYCILDDGTTCPYYHEGHCAQAHEEEMLR